MNAKIKPISTHSEIASVKGVMHNHVTNEEKQALLQPADQSGQYFVPTVVNNIEHLIDENSPNLITYLTLCERNLSKHEKEQVIARLTADT